MNIHDVPADINDRTYRFTQKAGSAQIIFHRGQRSQYDREHFEHLTFILSDELKY